MHFSPPSVIRGTFNRQRVLNGSEEQSQRPFLYQAQTLKTHGIRNRLWTSIWNVVPNWLHHIQPLLGWTYRKLLWVVTYQMTTGSAWTLKNVHTDNCVISMFSMLLWLINSDAVRNKLKAFWWVHNCSYNSFAIGDLCRNIPLESSHEPAILSALT